MDIIIFKSIFAFFSPIDDLDIIQFHFYIACIVPAGSAGSLIVFCLLTLLLILPLLYHISNISKIKE